MTTWVKLGTAYKNLLSSKFTMRPDGYLFVPIKYDDEVNVFIGVKIIGETYEMAVEDMRNEDDWELAPLPARASGRLAPALFVSYGGRGMFYKYYSITTELFESKEAAENHQKGRSFYYFVKWPASESLWVNVPVEEKL